MLTDKSGRPHTVLPGDVLREFPAEGIVVLAVPLGERFMAFAYDIHTRQHVRSPGLVGDTAEDAIERQRWQAARFLAGEVRNAG